MPPPIWPAPMTPTVLIMSELTIARPSLALGELGVELGHDLEEIADEAVIGDLEDGRLLVLVDGDDDLRILHAGKVLNGAGDADRDVELRRHDLAGLADLVIVRHETGIDRGARGADGGAELVGDAFEQAEIVARLHAAAAGDDDSRARQLRPLRFRQLGADIFRKAGRTGTGRAFDGGAAALGGRRRKAGRAHGDDL